MIIRERERVRGPGCVCVLFFLSRHWDSYCFDFFFFQCVVQCGWRSRKTSIEPSRKKICPNSLFLFVGVSLFFVSSCTISIGTRTHQPLKKKWTKTKSASTQSSLLCSRSHSTAHFFFYSLTVRTPPDYLPYFGSWFMYSRLNVLVVSTMRKKSELSFFFRHSKRFLPSFRLFTFDTWMNARSDAMLFSLYFTIMPTIVPIEKASKKRLNEKKDYMVRHWPDYLFHMLTSIYLRVLLYDINTNVSFLAQFFCVHQLNVM